MRQLDKTRNSRLGLREKCQSELKIEQPQAPLPPSYESVSSRSLRPVCERRLVVQSHRGTFQNVFVHCFLVME